jgi:altronate dehydratase large subunit
MSDSYFLGYRRANGTIGIRNHVLVLAVMDNVNGVVKNISQLVSPSLPVTVWARSIRRG